MSDAAEDRSFDDAQLSWKTLGHYARAAHDFTRTAPAILPPSAFDRVASMDLSDLPPAERFELSDGFGLGFRRYGAGDSKRVLVLIHGSGCFADQFHAMARQIAEQDLAQVYTLDMRGHGLSEGPRGHAVTEAGQLVSDIAEFIRHLAAGMTDARFVLGGHSAGGGVVLAFSRSRFRDLVSSYLFIAPFLGLGSETIRPHFGGWVKVRGLRLQAISLANLFNIKAFNDATVVEFNMAACAPDRRYVPSWSFNTMLAFGPGRWLPDAPPIPAEKPVLLLAGRGDDCFVQPLFRKALDVIAPHAEAPDVGPGGHWDVLGEPVAIREVCKWLSRQPAGGRRDRPASITRAA